MRSGWKAGAGKSKVTVSLDERCRNKAASIQGQVARGAGFVSLSRVLEECVGTADARVVVNKLKGE